MIEAEGQTGGRGGTVNLALYSASGTRTPLVSASLTAAAGGGQPHTNVQPYLALNFCIALQGIFRREAKAAAPASRSTRRQ